MVVIEFFYSPLCTYCTLARSVVEDLSAELGDEVSLKIEEYNVFSDIGMKRKEVYNITEVPTLIINGRIRITGAPDRDRLRQIVEKESSSTAEQQPQNRPTSEPDR